MFTSWMLFPEDTSKIKASYINRVLSINYEILTIVARLEVVGPDNHLFILNFRRTLAVLTIFCFKCGMLFTMAR